MINILPCILFSISKKGEALREFWRVEVIRKDVFSWRRAIVQQYNNRRRNYIFWWRLANEMHEKGSKRQRKIASKINRRLLDRYATDIELGARIGERFHISHHAGLVISKRAIIGANVTVRQNTTIGLKKGIESDEVIVIGNNVNIGANSCIIGAVKIGDNVQIGAMSFVNNDIPSNSTYITKKACVITCH